MVFTENNSLIGCSIGIELYSKDRIFGKVDRWSELSIWIIKEGEKNPIEVPKEIIVRSFILLEGGI